MKRKIKIRSEYSSLINKQQPGGLTQDKSNPFPLAIEGAKGRISLGFPFLRIDFLLFMLSYS